MTEMSWAYSPEPASCGRVRRDLQEFLGAFGIPADPTDVALLIVNELASNAVDHARTLFGVIARITGGELWISVTDGSDEPLQQRPIDPLAVRGRGLQMVDALSDRWAVTVHERGKTVTAVLVVEDPDLRR